ncbi:MAG: extracellular solute-binding protein [Alphaproteobacteria bacterium]|nr:extracellular solute-binding protein [Alphaproteobacteria bacterium]
MTRRAVLRNAVVAAVAAPFVHGAHAAGTLSVGFWDHWVPGANEPLAELCREWAAREKVEIKIDFITASGDKDLLTAAAESQSKTGHDVLGLLAWYAPGYADSLEPVDDVMAELIHQHGPAIAGAEYLGKQNGHWIAVPTAVGSTVSPPCARIDLMKQITGIDVTRMYPPNAPADPALTADWTWEGFSQAAEKCFKAGYPFGMPISTCSDSVQWVGALFNSHGAELVDASGAITVDSDPVRTVLEWAKKTVRFFPESVFAWDDSSNNKALISGQSALIFNAPSAWAVAKRDAPKIAEQLWTFPTPKGPKGRHVSGRYRYWGIWNFSQNKSAAKSLLLSLSSRASMEKLMRASQGFDVPPFASLSTFDIWAEAEPPKGTLYNFPPRGDVIVSVACSPAPARIGVQMYSQATMCKMIAQCTQQGKSVDEAIAFGRQELEGFMRS